MNLSPNRNILKAKTVRGKMMAGQSTGQSDQSNTTLWQQAERLLAGNRRVPVDPSPDNLLLELQIHQMALEIQSQKLNQAQTTKDQPGKRSLAIEKCTDSIIYDHYTGWAHRVCQFGLLSGFDTLKSERHANAASMGKAAMTPMINL